MYICACMGICLLGKHPSIQLFISLAKSQKLSLFPTHLVIEMTEEFTLAFVQRSKISFFSA